VAEDAAATVVAMPSVFDFLKQVEQRPRMFFTQLCQLESILFGYQSALRVHSIDERGLYIGHFREWLEYERSGARGLGRPQGVMTALVV